MKLKIFPIANLTEANVEQWSQDKFISHMLVNESNLYVFYELGDEQ